MNLIVFIICYVSSEAVRRSSSKETESEITTAVKDWLKYAKDREGGRKAREARRSVAHSNE